MIKNLLAVLIVSFGLTANSSAQVAVAVGGSWGGVAVSTGGYGYGGYYGYAGAVAPVGGWYPFYYSSSFYAAPIPQAIPMVQPVGPYTTTPCYYVQQPQVVVQTPARCQCRKNKSHCD
jgi:hypothetical protein